MNKTCALAQDSTDIGHIDVQSDAPGNGMMTQEDTPKARSSITRAAIDDKSTLNNSFQLISLLINVRSTGKKQPLSGCYVS